MLNSMCKLDRGMVAKTFRDNHHRGVLDEINTGIHRLSKAEGLWIGLTLPGMEKVCSEGWA